MRNILLPVAVGSFLSLSVPATAATLELDPSSDWAVREFDHKCRMIQTFGEGEDQVTLWLEKAGSSKYLNLTAIGNPLGNPFGSRITVALTPNAPQNRGYITATSKKGSPVLSMFGVPHGDVTQPGSVPDDTFDPINGTTGAMVEENQGNPAISQPVQSIDLAGALEQKVSLKINDWAGTTDQLQECADAAISKRNKSK